MFQHFVSVWPGVSAALTVSTLDKKGSGLDLSTSLGAKEATLDVTFGHSTGLLGWNQLRGCKGAWWDLLLSKLTSWSVLPSLCFPQTMGSWV